MNSENEENNSEIEKMITRIGRLIYFNKKYLSLLKNKEKRKVQIKLLKNDLQKLDKLIPPPTNYRKIYLLYNAEIEGLENTENFLQFINPEKYKEIPDLKNIVDRFNSLIYMFTKVNPSQLVEEEAIRDVNADLEDENKIENTDLINLELNTEVEVIPITFLCKNTNVPNEAETGMISPVLKKRLEILEEHARTLYHEERNNFENKSLLTDFNKNVRKKITEFIDYLGTPCSPQGEFSLTQISNKIQHMNEILKENNDIINNYKFIENIEDIEYRFKRINAVINNPERFIDYNNIYDKYKPIKALIQQLSQESLTQRSNNLILEVNKYPTNEKFLKNMKGYEIVYEKMDDILDCLYMLPESEEELLRAQTHFINIQNILESCITSKDYSSTEISSVSSLGSRESTGSRGSRGSRGSNGGGKNKKQKGGTSQDDFCSGSYLNLNDNDNDPNQPLISALGITKTLDELLHDFAKPNKEGIPYLNRVNIDELKRIYKSYISVMIEKVDNNNEVKSYMESVKDFSIIDDSNEIVKDKEWNYYTSTLKFMDDYCNKLGNLNITKFAKLDDLKYLDDKSKSFLAEKNFLKSIPNSDGTTSDDYFYSNMNSLPIEPIFSISNVDKKLEDNPTPYRKLQPLVNENLNRENMEKIITPASLLDPSTTGNVEISKFNEPDLGEYKNIIQKMQNINESTPEAQYCKNILKKCLENFISYFGANIKLTDVSLIEEDQKFSGLNIDYNSNQYQLKITDTTIDNISKFKNQYNNDPIPNSIDNFTNDSWKRLHSFSKLIFENVNDAIKNEVIRKYNQLGEGISAEGDLAQSKANNWLLTEIIISLKSMGDSLQVNYNKMLFDYLNNNVIDGLEKPVDSYISSSDKNVAAESFLISNPFLINGTGVRPHSNFFKTYKKFFSDPTKSDDSPINEKIDTMATITTNKMLMDENTVMKQLISNYEKLIPYLINKPFVNSELNLDDGTFDYLTSITDNEKDGNIIYLFDENNDETTNKFSISEKLNIILETLSKSYILNTSGEQIMSNLINKYNDED